MLQEAATTSRSHEPHGTTVLKLACTVNGCGALIRALALGGMVVEVYTGHKPALVNRTWLSTVAMLIIASGLAASMTWQRSGRLLADRIVPAGWGISFRPPRDFESVSRDGSDPPAAVRYRLVGAHGAAAELAVWQIHAPAGVNATRVCDVILRQIDVSWLRSFFSPPPTRAEAELGGRRAVEILDPATQTAVRAIVLDSGVAYAVSLRVEGAAMDKGVYRLFDLTCRSVEFDED